MGRAPSPFAETPHTLRHLVLAMDLFQTALALTSLVTAVITLKARGAAADAATKKPQDFNTFQTSFLITYYIGVAADWLQGPYVYALYSSYG